MLNCLLREWQTFIYWMVGSKMINKGDQPVALPGWKFEYTLRWKGVEMKDQAIRLSQNEFKENVMEVDYLRKSEFRWAHTSLYW